MIAYDSSTCLQLYRYYSCTTYVPRETIVARCEDLAVGQTRKVTF